MKTLIVANRAFRTLVASYVRKYNPIGDVLEAGTKEKAMSLLREHNFVDVIVLDSKLFPDLGIQHEHGRLVEIHDKPVNPKLLNKFKDKLKKIYA